MIRLAIITSVLIISSCQQPSSTNSANLLNQGGTGNKLQLPEVFSSKAANQAKEKIEYQKAISQLANRCFTVDSVKPKTASHSAPYSKYLCTSGKNYGFGWQYLGEGVHHVGVDGGFVGKKEKDLTIYHGWFSGKWVWKKVGEAKYEVEIHSVSISANDIKSKLIGKMQLSMLAKSAPLKRQPTSKQLSFIKSQFEGCKKIADSTDYNFLKPQYQSVFKNSKLMCFEWSNSDLSVSFKKSETSAPLLTFRQPKFEINGYKGKYESVSFKFSQKTTSGNLLLKTLSNGQSSENGKSYRHHAFSIRFENDANAYLSFDLEKELI